MTKWHAQVVHMAKNVNMVGGPDPLSPPKSGAEELYIDFVILTTKKDFLHRALLFLL